jgi:hypothetical protein
MEIVLINEELFKENGPIKEDTIITKFAPYINIAQKIYIEKILGKPLTDELKGQIKKASAEGATGGEITPENQALILKIAPALSFYAVYQGLPFHWASIVNKGLTLRNSENSDAVSVNDVAQLRRWIKDDAEELARDLIDYLRNCKDTYPLWKPGNSCGCGDNGEGSTKSPFESGIFIPKKR